MTGGTIGFVGGWTCLQSSSSVWVGGHNGGLGHPHSAAVDAFSCRRSVQYLSRPVVAVPLRNRVRMETCEESEEKEEVKEESATENQRGEALSADGRAEVGSLWFSRV